MKNYRKIGAVLMAILALALIPAAALATTSSHQIATHHGGILEWILGLGLAMGGAVVVTYSGFGVDAPTPQIGTLFAGGGTVPPSAAQSATVNRINALVGFTDADTSITVTHNWNLSAAAQTANEPDIIIHDTALGTGAASTQSGLTWAVSTNTVVGTKSSIAGSGRTICITLRLPATPGN